MRVTSRPGMSFAVVICSLAISSKAWADKVDLRPNAPAIASLSYPKTR